MLRGLEVRYGGLMSLGRRNSAQSNLMIDKQFIQPGQPGVRSAARTPGTRWAASSQRLSNERFASLLVCFYAISALRALQCKVNGTPGTRWADSSQRSSNERFALLLVASMQHLR